MMVLSANRIPNAIVQRFRLRSTSEPPPSGPAPVPTPNAPDRPASFPECMSTRKIRTTEMKTWTTERMTSMAGMLAVRLVQGPQDLYRLGAQPGVESLPVGAGELAGAAIELRVADLAVLRLLGRLERRAVQHRVRLGRLHGLPGG